MQTSTTMGPGGANRAAIPDVLTLEEETRRRALRGLRDAHEEAGRRLQGAQEQCARAVAAHEATLRGINATTRTLLSVDAIGAQPSNPSLPIGMLIRLTRDAGRAYRRALGAEAHSTDA